MKLITMILTALLLMAVVPSVMADEEMISDIRCVDVVTDGDAVIVPCQAEIMSGVPEGYCDKYPDVEWACPAIDPRAADIATMLQTMSIYGMADPKFAESKEYRENTAKYMVAVFDAERDYGVLLNLFFTYFR